MNVGDLDTGLRALAVQRGCTVSELILGVLSRHLLRTGAIGGLTQPRRSDGIELLGRNPRSTRSSTSTQAREIP